MEVKKYKNYYKEKIYYLGVFLGSVSLWSFLSFSLLKIFFIIYNQPIFLILGYSAFSFLFWVYYYINSGYLMPFWKYVVSYFLICLCVYGFHKLYDALILLHETLQDNQFLLIYLSGLIPAIILYFVGRLFLKAFKSS